MKIMKKLSKGILAVVMCLLLVTTVWAAGEVLVTYSATLNDAEICVNELAGQAQTVILTAKVDEKVDMDAFTAQVKAPEGWTIKGVANNTLNFGESNYNLENGMILWYAIDAENVSNDLLADVTVEVPAGTAMGAYEIEFEIIDISRDWGMPWENGKILTATLTVVDHADGDDADHLCDCCGGAVEGEDCVYVPGDYVWAEDYSACTVVGTCACGETATATAKSTSKVTTTGTCQTEEVVTYTADFAETWAVDQTKAVTGQKNADNHAGEQTTTYTNNGENHTVTVTCACGAQISQSTEEHTYVDGKCVCGAEEPTEPSEPDVPVTGLKGDVDLDGDVDAYDLTLLAQHVGGIAELTDPTALVNADVTVDGIIDAYDMTLMAQYVGGIISDWN